MCLSVKTVSPTKKDERTELEGTFGGHTSACKATVESDKGALKTQVLEIASTGKASRNSAFRKDGKRKYGKRKYESTWVENTSTENASTMQLA